MSVNFSLYVFFEQLTISKNMVGRYTHNTLKTAQNSIIKLPIKNPSELQIIKNEENYSVQGRKAKNYIITMNHNITWRIYIYVEIYWDLLTQFFSILSFICEWFYCLCTHAHIQFFCFCSSAFLLFYLNGHKLFWSIESLSSFQIGIIQLLILFILLFSIFSHFIRL